MSLGLPTRGPNGSRIVDVHLGQDTHGADGRWRISTSGSPHMFVLGIPGQGKSVTTRRILNSFADQGLPAFVVDFHGDMASAPAGGASVALENLDVGQAYVSTSEQAEARKVLMARD